MAQIPRISTRPETSTDGELAEGWTPSGVLGDPVLHPDTEGMELAGKLKFWANGRGDKVGIVKVEGTQIHKQWRIVKFDGLHRKGAGWETVRYAGSREEALEQATKVAQKTDCERARQPTSTDTSTDTTKWQRRTRKVRLAAQD